MKRQPSDSPIISIEERGGRIVAIRVRHAGRLPPLPARFTPDVVHRALSMSRTRFEHKVLTAARRLGRVGYRVVERSLIMARCERVLERQAARGGKPFARPSRKTSAGPSITESWAAKHNIPPVVPTRESDLGRGR